MACCPPIPLSQSQFVAVTPVGWASVSTDPANPTIVNVMGPTFTLVAISNISLKFAGTITNTSEGGTIVTVVLEYYNILTPTVVTEVAVPIQVSIGARATVTVTPTLFVPNLTLGTYKAQVGLYAEDAITANVSGELSIVTIRTGQ